MRGSLAGGSVESNSDTGTELGRWSDEDFESTVSLYGGVGADADVPDESRFVAGVVQLLRKRTAELQATCQGDENDIAIFILKSGPPETISSAKRVPMVDNGLTMVVGRLWFTAAPVVSAHYVELPQGTDDEGRFSYVTNELDLGSRPTLIFDPRTATPELRWYPNGLGQPDSVELKPLAGDVGPDDVFEAINELYQECLVTPDSLPHGVNLWKDADRHWPRSDAEALVQSLLKAGLVLRFPHCRVWHEQPQQAGRSDLEIVEPDPLDRSIVRHHAILELKVLRSFRSGGSTVSANETNDWIEEGVRQAVAYRRIKGARWSALCCFDMRTNNAGDKATFAQVRECATALNVLLTRWFLYASSADYRQAMACI